MRLLKPFVNKYDLPEEVNTLPSETVPDQSMTVREILLKYASGIPMQMQRDLTFSEDLPDLRGMDITEMQDMAAANKLDIDTLEKQVVSEIKSKKSNSKVSEEDVLESGSSDPE